MAKDRVSSLEVYGFVGWISSSAVLGLYVAWACVPSSVLDALGITYYPSRYWVIAVPVWLSIGMIVYLAGYHAANFLQANDPDSINNLVDRHTLVPSQYACLPAASEPHDRPSAAASSEPLPAMEDLPATLVSRVLYGGVPLPQACEAEQRDPLFDAIPRREASARGLASST